MNVKPIKNISSIAEKHYTWICKKKWNNSSLLEYLTLVISEIGEASNEVRGIKLSDNFKFELSDIILRILAISEHYSLGINETLFSTPEYINLHYSTLEQLGDLIPSVSQCISLYINLEPNENIDKLKLKKELSDVILKVCLIAENLHIDIENAITLKMEKNFNTANTSTKIK